MSREASREELIVKYFSDGYKYKEIQKILATHEYNISEGYLKVLIKRLGLKRKFLSEDIDQITLAILHELEESGQCLGYKSMWQRLKLQYGLEVYRETVLDLLRILDPDGIEERCRYRLKRREYKVPGPNFCWHIDGYDKLKPYGFAIHGCMDGFSRKCMWLEVASTNNKPEIVVYYYLKTIKKYNLIPTLLRSDCGTENTSVELLHMALRSDHTDSLAGEHSFIKGKSTANQRIESSWGQMRRHSVQFWINYFKNMVDDGVFRRKNPMQLECLRFCFGPLIAYDLSRVRKEWNVHIIRKQSGTNVVSGKPNFLFYEPDQNGGMESGKPAVQEHIERAFEQYSEKPNYCSSDFRDMVKLIFEDKQENLSTPTTVIEAQDLYHKILNYVAGYDSIESDDV